MDLLNDAKYFEPIEWEYKLTKEEIQELRELAKYEQREGK